MPLTAQSPSQYLIDIVGSLGGTWSGNTAMCRCPAHADSKPSLSLRQGDSGILVTCFAGCDREDVLRELSRVRPGQHYPAPPVAEPRGKANVERLWGEGREVRGSLAERYVIRRHLGDLPDLRFHPRCPHGPKPFTKFKPALLVAVREGRNLRALQRIFLDPVTNWYEAKVMIGSPGQGAWQGAPVGDTLAIAEGFETAASFMALHDIPCWASLGARRLDQLAIPECVTTLIIAEDSDPEGHRAARRAWARYKGNGLTIRRMPPPTGAGDWAEALELRG